MWLRRVGPMLASCCEILQVRPMDHADDGGLAKFFIEQPQFLTATSIQNHLTQGAQRDIGFLRNERGARVFRQENAA